MIAKDIQKDFNKGIIVYDYNLHDVFGNKFYLIYNEDMQELKYMAKCKDYKKKRKSLDERGYNYIVIQKYYDVIDMTLETYNKILKYIPSGTKYYRHKDMLTIYDTQI